jgi:hypothetical protein
MLLEQGMNGWSGEIVYFDAHGGRRPWFVTPKHLIRDPWHPAVLASNASTNLRTAPALSRACWLRDDRPSSM